MRKHIVEGMKEGLAKAETAHECGLEKTQMQRAWNRYSQCAAIDLSFFMPESDGKKASEQVQNRLIAFKRRNPIVVSGITVYLGGKRWIPDMRKPLTSLPVLYERYAEAFSAGGGAAP